MLSFILSHFKAWCFYREAAIYKLGLGCGTLSLALGTLCLVPDRGIAANEMPGYVVLPLTAIGSHAAGVRATIDGHPVSLIIDTGASHSVLDRRFYKGIVKSTNTNAQSALPPGFPTSAQFNGVKADVGQIENLQAGPMHFGSGPIMVTDLSGMRRPWAEYNHRHPDAPVGGLLGEDILTTYAAIIDWRRQGIYFNTVPSKRLKLGKALLTSGWTAVPMTRANSRLFVVPTIVDDHPYQLIVDTGASYTTFDSGLLKSADVLYNRGALIMNMIGSTELGRPMIPKNWLIGNYRVPPVSVVTQRLPSDALNQSGTTGKGPVLGLLGREVLARNSAIIDISGATLYLKPANAR